GAVFFSAVSASITSSTFANNHATTDAGAVFILGASGTTSLLTNDTLTGNSASLGGAVDTGGLGNVAFLNDTINGNTATKQGGGVDILGPGKVSFQNTIVALDASPSGPDVFTVTNVQVTDNGGNLIGTLTGNTGFGAGTLTGDPRLGPLQNNGGPLVGLLG